MNRRGRKAEGKLPWALLLLITLVVLGAAGFYAATAFQRFQERSSSASAAEILVGESQLPDGPFVLFRNTAAGQGYGLAATVPISSPRAGRSVSRTACDRVYGSAHEVVCLRSNRGLVTSYEAAVYDRNWAETQHWALPGIPSRARIDPSGAFVATTVFVTGHSYSGAGFSTETAITGLDGRQGTGNLEDFTLTVNGSRITAADRNIWGVTFAPGQSDSFFATAASSGRIWLVKGSLTSRILTAVHDGVECPSVSPDGTRLAFKKNLGDGLVPHWGVAILDLASGEETVLAETRNVDDQVEWLDDETLLYGLPRAADAGDSDIWALKADPASRPSVFIEHAWSPSVVRG